MGSQLNPGVHGHLNAKKFDMAWKPLEPPKARNKVIGYEDDPTEETTPEPKPEPGPKPPEPRSPEPGSPEPKPPEPMTTKSPTRPKTPMPSLSAAADASPPSTEKRSKLTEINPEREGAAPSPQQDRVDPHSTPAVHPVPVGKVRSGAGAPQSQASAGRTDRSSRGRVGTPVPLSGDVPIDRTEHYGKPMETVRSLKERVVAAVGNHRMER